MDFLAYKPGPQLSHVVLGSAARRRSDGTLLASSRSDQVRIIIMSSVISLLCKYTMVRLIESKKQSFTEWVWPAGYVWRQWIWSDASESFIHICPRSTRCSSTRQQRTFQSNLWRTRSTSIIRWEHPSGNFAFIEQTSRLIAIFSIVSYDRFRHEKWIGSLR